MNKQEKPSMLLFIGSLFGLLLFQAFFLVIAALFGYGVIGIWAESWSSFPHFCVMLIGSILCLAGMLVMLVVIYHATKDVTEHFRDKGFLK